MFYKRRSFVKIICFSIGENPLFFCHFCVFLYRYFSPERTSAYFMHAQKKQLRENSRSWTLIQFPL